MAVKVAGFEVVSRASKYPWSEWTDGSVWELSKGDDYDKLGTIRAIVYVTASKRKLSVKTLSLDGGKRFQLQFGPAKTKLKKKTA